jgi:D-glycero-beta-D-manno-heptose-7-phosphate kinase
LIVGMLRPTRQILDTFRGRRVLIAGDLVADQFLEGTISRVSREAPVFIMRHDSTETRPGGAANAAANVASLGGVPVIIGLTGADASGDLLRSALAERGADCERVLRVEGVHTTTKVRVLAGQQYAARQQVIRIDYESPSHSADIDLRLTEHLVEAAPSADAIVVSDYGYGAVSPGLFEAAKRISRDRNIPLVVDSRFRLEAFAGASTATPNQDEVEHILGPGFTDVDCESLRRRLNLEALLVTRGNKGMLLVEEGRDPRAIEAVGPTAPVDVTGAGDTVIAAYALGLAAGLPYSDAASIANHAGGVVVMKRGTATATSEELIAFAREATSDGAAKQAL